jgi:hypothetical protein
MSQPRETTRTPERAVQFAYWLERVFKLFKNNLGWSQAKTMDASTVSSSAIFRWKDTSEKGQFPEPETLDRFCAKLYEKFPSPVLNPEVPYGILGWGKPASMAAERVEDARAHLSMTDLDIKINRVNIVLKGKFLDDEEREEYKTMLADLESARAGILATYERTVDSILEELERREQRAQAEDE